MRKTKNLTTGAITLGLSAILILLDTFTAGSFMVILALPLVIYGYYFSIKETLITYVCTVILSFIITGYIPTIITVSGYGLIGLALVVARRKQLKTNLTYIMMYVAALPVYVVMISFFDVYFLGQSIQEMFEITLTYLPHGFDTELVVYVVYISLMLLPLMECYIIKISSQLVIRFLDNSKTFRALH